MPWSVEEENGWLHLQKREISGVWNPNLHSLTEDKFGHQS